MQSQQPFAWHSNRCRLAGPVAAAAEADEGGSAWQRKCLFFCAAAVSSALTKLEAFAAYTSA